MTRQPHDLHDYQNRAIRHALDRPCSMLWLDVGLGKTIVSLSAILDRLDNLTAYGTLVFAPKRVCTMVWAQESKAWAHTKHMTFSLIQGNARQRHYALRKSANVHLCNYENVAWLADEIINIWLSRGDYPPWQTVIYDEVDKMKDSTGVRSRAWQRVLPYFPNRIGLTGTPGSNGYPDLFGQFLVVDGGVRLGTSYTAFTEKYFYKDGYRLKLRKGAADELKAILADITLQMSQEEYLPMLHKPIINDIYVDLPPKVREQYDQLEREMFFELDGGAEIEVFNKAALINKCLQAANGAPYVVPNSGVWAPMHDEKLNVLDDIVSESNGQPLLVAYQFTSDRDRILERYPKARVLGGTMLPKDEQRLQAEWDAGEIEMLLGHPASMGHGLNLQHGGHIGVLFGLTWSLGLYLQLLGRLARQGQERVPIFHRIMARATADEIQRDVLASKDDEQADLKRTINNYRGRRGQ